MNVGFSFEVGGLNVNDKDEPTFFLYVALNDVEPDVVVELPFHISGLLSDFGPLAS